MGGILDFINQGQSPPNVSTSGTTTTSLPSWLNDYAMQTIAQANQIAAQPYTPYQGPRIAPLNATQNQAFDLAKTNVGNYQPSLTQASGLINSAMDPSAGGLAQAQPYLSGAGQRFSDPNVVSSYMNPYTKNVIDQGTSLAMQNYNQNIKPSLDNQFTASGQYGSSAHERAAGQLANQLTQNIQQADQGALSQAYNTAGSLFGQDTSRLAQLGSIAGNLGLAGQQNKLAGAGQLGALGQLYSGLGAGDVSQLANVGALQQSQTQNNLNLAYQDFLNQRDWPKSQLGWEAGIVSGLPHGQTQATTGSAPLPGATYGNSPLNSIIGGLSTAGGLYKQFTQPGGFFGNSSNPDYGTISQELNTPGIDLSQPLTSYSDYSPGYSTGFNDPSQGNLYTGARGGLARVYRGSHHGR